jgi:hypothetical protein
MTKARNLRRGATFPKLVGHCGCSRLSLSLADCSRSKPRPSNSPSAEFADDGCVLEIICKSWRDFAASPYRPDNRGGRRVGAPGPVPPVSPEPVE